VGEWEGRRGTGKRGIEFPFDKILEKPLLAKTNGGSRGGSRGVSSRVSGHLIRAPFLKRTVSINITGNA